MVLQEDQDRVKHLLSEALPMLCKSGLSYSSEFCIEALIGITLDKNDVFLVSIKETIKSDVDIIGNDRTLNEKSVEINVTRMNGNEKLPNRFRRRKRQSCTSRRGLDSGSEQEQDEVEVKRERIASTEPTDEEIADTSFNDGSEAGPIIVKQEPFITESRSYVPSFHSALYPGEGTKLSHHSALSLLQEVDKSLNTPSGAFNTSMNDSLLAEYNEAVNNSALDVTGAIPIHVDSLPALEEINALSPGQRRRGAPSSSDYAIRDKISRVPEGYMCMFCMQIAKRRDSIRRHIKSVHLKMLPFSCSRCGHRFGYRHNALVHEQRCRGPGLSGSIIGNTDENQTEMDSVKNNEDAALNLSSEKDQSGSLSECAADIPQDGDTNENTTSNISEEITASDLTET